MDKIDYGLLIKTINNYSYEVYRIFKKLRREDLKSGTNIIQYGSYASFERVVWEESNENNICIRYYDHYYGLCDSNSLVIPANILFNDEKIDKWIQSFITDELKKVEESKQKAELKKSRKKKKV